MWKLYNLLPLPYYGPEDEGKSAAQLEREKIKSNVPPPPKEEGEENAEAEVSEGDEGSEEGEEEGQEESEEGESEEGEEGKAEELTAEQKQIKALERKLERLQKRVGKTAGERDQIKKELKEAKTALEARLAEGEQPLTEEEVNRRARELAQQELTQKEFSDAENRLVREATKIDKNFMSKINDLAADVAPIPPFFIGALDDLDNGGEVLNYLSDNADEYEDLIGINKPTKIIKGLVEISNKLIEAKKPKPKPISKVPDPPKGIKGGNSSPDVLPAKPTENMEEFVRIREKQIAERNKAKYGR